MRVNVITSADPDIALNMITSGGYIPDNALQDIQNRYNQFVTKLRDRATEFIEYTQRIADYFSNSRVVRTVKEAIDRTDIVLNENSIYRLNEETIYNPGFRMRRYMMALPDVYNLYSKNRCSGYEDEWFDPQPLVKEPTIREDYLRVVDGIMQWREDGNGYIIFSSVDDKLSLVEQLKILDSWDIAKRLINEGLDPTDPNRGEL